LVRSHTTLNPLPLSYQTNATFYMATTVQIIYYPPFTNIFLSHFIPHNL